ncbi:uncharacterized protein [Amphiura filiformis]|uniref:uncharacterized protein n=1 Tax=Amphiura filiformis TaxID=82378 RepID=UPI003B2161F4
MSNPYSPYSTIGTKRRKLDVPSHTHQSTPISILPDATAQAEASSRDDSGEAHDVGLPSHTHQTTPISILPVAIAQAEASSRDDSGEAHDVPSHTHQTTPISLQPDATAQAEKASSRDDSGEAHNIPSHTHQTTPIPLLPDATAQAEASSRDDSDEAHDVPSHTHQTTPIFLLPDATAQAESSSRDDSDEAHDVPSHTHQTTPISILPDATAQAEASSRDDSDEAHDVPSHTHQTTPISLQPDATAQAEASGRDDSGEAHDRCIMQLADTPHPGVTTSSAANMERQCQDINPEASNIDLHVASNIDLTVASNIDLPVASNSDLPVASNSDLPVASNSDLPVASNSDLSVASNSDLPVASNSDLPVASNSDLPVASNSDLPVASNSDLPVASNSDLPVASNSDLPGASNSDLPVASNSDLPVASNSDLPVASNSDLPVASNSDLPVASNSDLPVASNSDLPVASNSDLPVASNSDLPVASNSDLPVASNSDLPVARHSDLPVASNSDLPVASNSDLPVASNSDLPVASNSDLPVASNSDLPVASNSDLPVASNSDLPVASNSDLPVASNSDLPVASNIELPVASNSDLPVVLNQTYVSGNQPRSGGDMYNIEGDAHIHIHEASTALIDELMNRQDCQTTKKCTGESCLFDLDGCKQELIKFYKHQMSKIQLLPWCDESRAMDEIYVSLELEEKTSMIQHNEDLVTLTTAEGQPATRVLVKGVAGSGKSTLLAKLAYSWAQQKSDSSLSNYDLVFIITLRELHRDNSLVDAIFEQILADDTNVSKNELQAFLEKNPDKVIILLDGYDEYAHSVDQTSAKNGIDRILQYRLLRDCRVILSTRAHKHLGQYQMKYVSVNLTGFSPENVELYMTRFFHGNNEMVEGLKNRLKESQILTSLSTIPVILMLMCLLWEDEQKLPEAQSELYHNFVLYLWRKHCIRNGKQDQSDSDAEFIKAISELGQTAFEGLCLKETLKDEKLVFSENNFTHSQFQLGCETGLLTRERFRSKLNTISSVTFLHKSFQEYCAAKYLADLFETNPDQFHCTLMQIDSWDLLLSKMELLKFCCGVVDRAGRIDIILHAIHLFKLNTDSMNDHVHVGARIITFVDDTKKDLLPILNLLYDSQITPGHGELETTQHHDQVYTDSTMLPRDEQQQSPGGMLSLGQAVKSLFSKGKLRVLSKPPQSMPIFHNFVMSAFGLLSLSKIKSASFEYDLSVAPLDVVTGALQCMPVIQDVSINHWTDYTKSHKAFKVDHHMKLLGEALSSLSRLGTISFKGKIGTCTDIHTIVHSLSLSSYCPHYTHIEFDSATFNITHMAHLLSKTMHLKELNLFENEMTPSDVMSLLDAIQSNLEYLSLNVNHVGEAIGHIDHIMTPHLQKLELRTASLNEEHITILSESLPKATNLQVLILSCNTVGMAAAPLAQQLQYCPKLMELWLADADIPDQGIIEIANRFVFLPSLSLLDLYGNDAGNGGIHGVFKHLQNLPKLKWLSINATIDNQCSALVKDCLSAIDKTVPDTKGPHHICVVISEDKAQLLIKAASKHANQN